MVLTRGVFHSTFKQLFWGTKEFIEEMEEKFKTKNTRLKRGRPKKEIGIK